MTHPQSMIETLPYDILQTIIQELAEESAKERKKKETLSACSLTCRAFVHPCRTHLFSTIDFSRYPTGRLDKPPHLVLQNTLLAAYCQTLVYELGPPHETDGMAEALLHLKNIRSFTLLGHRLRGWSALSPRTQQAFIHLFSLPSLTKIVIMFQHNEGLPAILLASCRNLVNLFLIGCINLTSTSCLADLSPPPRLLSLHLRCLDPAMNSLLDIRRSETVPIIDISHLQRLTVESCFSDDGYKIVEKILLVARKLEWLDCQVSPRLAYHNLARMLDLKSLTTLRSLHLRFSVEDEMQDPFSGLIEELEEMSRHKNTGLQELLLHLTIEHDVKCRFIDREWKKLDDVLGNPSAFLCLYSLTFKITMMHFQKRAQCEEQQKKFEDMKTRHLTRLSSRDFRFEFSVEIDSI
ncbi:hypothetical protein B0H34DRAFT_473651 [Crassisporium funariophilum]|nr:hypothetical protein B0H34DRAFT_473651 [Crassisporium funariophilum]